MYIRAPICYVEKFLVFDQVGITFSLPKHPIINRIQSPETFPLLNYGTSIYQLRLQACHLALLPLQPELRSTCSAWLNPTFT
jgi:hypothetical protein